MINREYIRQSIINHTGDKRIRSACLKVSEQTGIPDYVVYSFARCSLPREKDLVLLIKTLKLDTKKMFDI
ncbi:hypothetical protein CBE01nite_41160 [Clostridium beijerinckii]|uniref:XRE family transcriptional regulator n=1 Tax=Clostridium beijerinckii TaxID=1520 RepID=A0AB74VF20_CLOBE|nr:hypothetical protein [Clostridium beijerinckii]NRZ29423.1 hypothetical protein [Clostridium beijerinckii]NYB94807.1 hypothetical protein [Clostridium beijerinckii]OOM28043.1 hypothetical protein CLBEI_00190 [Clostridium beijerinckii]QUN35056.1 hypothetical protein KEC93_24575 [Clostridium beijerinckii]SQA99955.1 Uncharacterised protein [Clostridium beijerinckii]